MINSKKIKTIFYAFVIFIVAYIIAYEVWGFFHPKPWPIKLMADSLTYCLYRYNDVYKTLPDCLTEKDFPVLSEASKLIYYSKNGIRDSKGNIWLVVLQTEVPSTYYVGKITNEKDCTLVEKIKGDVVLEQEILKVKESRPVQK